MNIIKEGKKPLMVADFSCSRIYSQRCHMCKTVYEFAEDEVFTVVPKTEIIKEIRDEGHVIVFYKIVQKTEDLVTKCPCCGLSNTRTIIISQTEIPVDIRCEGEFI